MQTFIISMILFSVVVVYVALPSLANKTETAKSKVVDKGRTENMEQSTFADYRKPKKPVKRIGRQSALLPKSMPKGLATPWHSAKNSKQESSICLERVDTKSPAI